MQETSRFPRLRRPDQAAEPEAYQAVLTAIEAYQAGVRDKRPRHLPVVSKDAGQAARRRMYRLARREGFSLRTQVAQPKPDVWEVIYTVTGTYQPREGHQ